MYNENVFHSPELTCILYVLYNMINFDYITELVVAESVVVIKKLLQMQPAQHSEIIKHMAKLTDNIQVSMPQRDDTCNIINAYNTTIECFYYQLWLRLVLQF